MFPDSVIVQNSSQSETKVKYNLQFGIAPYCKKKLIYDVANSPFTFKFDETTNNQVKKQYDGYLQYWSKRQNEVVNRCYGSMFIGHCDSNQLVDHYRTFADSLELDSNFLLHLGMDGHHVNKCFQENFLGDLEKELDTSFLKLGTCSLHPVHTAFRKGIKELSFVLDKFFNDTFLLQAVEC